MSTTAVTNEEPQHYNNNRVHNVSEIPNTESPRLKAAAPPCDPFSTYAENVVPPELKVKLEKILEEKSDNFKTIGERDVLYYDLNMITGTLALNTRPAEYPN